VNTTRDQPAIRFTVLENFDGRLSKKIELDASGRFVKTGSTQLKLGRFETAFLPFDGQATEALRSLAFEIECLGPNQAIALGHYRDNAVPFGTVTTKAGEAAANAIPSILAPVSSSSETDVSPVAFQVTRSRENFLAEKGYGLVLLDGDGDTGLRQKVIDLYAAFGRVAMLTRPSASAGVYMTATGQQMPAGGEHVYIIASDASRTREVLECIDDLAWMKGCGRLELAKNGDALERSIVDTTVWAPERLVYEGIVTLGSGLAQRPRQATLFAGDALDVDAFIAFARKHAPVAEVTALKAAAKRDRGFLIRQQVARASWQADYAAKLATRGVDRTVAKRAAALLRASAGDKGLLTGSDVFVTRDGEEIPISEILLNPTRFDGVVGPDPIEGREYGTTTARVMAKEGRPVVFSYAHGPGVYRLGWDGMSIINAVSAGRITEPDKLVEAIAGAVMTESEESTIYRAVASAWSAAGITESGLNNAVATARQKFKEGVPLTDRQQDLYKRCKNEFATVHQREGRVAAIAAVEAVLAGAAPQDAMAVLGKVVWFIASKDAATGHRRPSLEHLINKIVGPGQAARMIDKAVAAIATGKWKRGGRSTGDSRGRTF